MTVGIVGHEAAKFTPATEQACRAAIRRVLCDTYATRVVSGACPLGGVDVWAIEEGGALGLDTLEFPPKKHNWDEGFKPRNQQIALVSALVVCFAVDVLPTGYTGRRFALCYHCGTRDHVKSGGCWTVRAALGYGHAGYVYVLKQIGDAASWT